MTKSQSFKRIALAVLCFGLATTPIRSTGLLDNSFQDKDQFLLYKFVEEVQQKTSFLKNM